MSEAVVNICRLPKTPLIIGGKKLPTGLDIVLMSQSKTEVQIPIRTKWTGAREKFPFLARILPSDPLKTHPLDHLVVVLDTSMPKGDLNLAIEKISNLGKHIPHGVNISFIEFSSTAKQSLNTRVMKDPSSFNPIIDAMSAVRSGGDSNVDAALDKVSEAIIKNEDDLNNPKRNLVLFLTSNPNFDKGKIREVASCTNSTFMVLGVGNNLDLEKVQSLAGYGSGMWAHLTKKHNPFETAVPEVIQGMNGESFLRCDAYDVQRAWRIGPYVSDVPFIKDRVLVGNNDTLGLHELRGGYSSNTAFVTAYKPDEQDVVKYKIARQSNGRINTDPSEINTPSDFGEGVVEKDFNRSTLEVQEQVESTVKQWLTGLSHEAGDRNAVVLLGRWGLLHTGDRIGGDDRCLLPKGLANSGDDSPGFLERLEKLSAELASENKVQSKLRTFSLIYGDITNSIAISEHMKKLNSGRAIKLGRGDDCDIRFISSLSHISNNHCEVFKRNGKLFIKDLNSRNGTFVNDFKLSNEEFELTSGDKIGLGLGSTITVNFTTS